MPDRDKPFRHHVRLNVNGELQIVRLPQAKRVAIGGHVSVLAVYPKAAKPEKQRLIVMWFERVPGGWKAINV
jgi:hypothetical protein